MTITNLGVEGGNPCGAGEGSGGTFKVAGNVEDENAVLEITNMAAVDGKSSSVNINSFYSDVFAGTLNLKDGVPECSGGSLDNSVTITGQLQGTDAVGVVDLFNQDINGSLILGSADSGATVIRGGEVGGTFYPSQFEGDFAGTATVGKVNAGGSVYAFDSNDHAAIISGTVTIDGDLDGLARVDGNLTGTLNINGQVSTHSGLDGLVWITHRVDGTVDIDDDVIGHVHFQNLLSGSGSLVIGGDVTGEIVIGDEDDVEGDTAGDITIALDLESGGLIDLHDAYVGMLNIQGNLVGDIDLANDLEGTIDIDGAASGDVDINGDVSGTVSIGGIFSNGGTIQLTGVLTSAGDIMVTGECRGDVIIGRSTAAGSLIHFPGGINGTGSLTINQSEGAYAAAGDITVGTLSGDAAEDTHMDGNITILDDSVTFCVYTGSSAGAGDLDGTLRIAVCDDDAYDHNVCIEGDVNGTIDIDESGCEDPPGAGIACLACSS